MLTARLWLPQPNDPSAGRYFTHQARLPFFEEVLRRARELPGVEAAAVVQSIPLDGQRNFATITIDGARQEPAGEIPTVQGNTVSADYFSLMRIPVRRGRVFDAIRHGGARCRHQRGDGAAIFSRRGSPRASSALRSGRVRKRRG